MDNLMFWILVFPVLLLMLLYYLGFLSIGIRTISSGAKSKRPRRKLQTLLLGIVIILFPFLLIKAQHIRADQKADQRAEQLAAIERVNLVGNMPRKFVTVGNFSDDDIAFIKRQYRIGTYPKTEAERLAAAYRHYRRTEFCHTHSSGKMMSSKIKIPICKDLPDSIQTALDLREPTLFFAEGSNTSYRVSNTSVGKMYEARLITKTRDRLVDYYEERFVERPAGITNPYSSGFKRVPNQPRFSRRDFIQRAMEGAAG